MPTVLRAGPYRFFFWSGDAREAAHSHVESGDRYAKFWLEPVSLAKTDGYNWIEIARIGRLVVAHRHELRERWRDFFGG